MRTALLLALLPLIAAALAAPVKWLSYEDALREARSSGRVVYVYFFSAGCPYCALMEGTFSDPRVAEALGRFEAARVDVRLRPDLASLYGVPGTPTHVFLCPNGSLLGVALGYRDPDSFLELLRRAEAEASRRCAPEGAASASGASPLEAAALYALAALLLGLATPLTPCVLPVLPVAYAVASRGRRGLAWFAAGVFVAYAAIGAAASGALLAVRSVAEGAAYALLLAAGLALAVERVGRLFTYAASYLASRLPRLPRGGSAFAAGALATILWGPCVAPMASAAVALSALQPLEHLAALSATAYAAGLALAVYALTAALGKARSLASRARALKRMNRALGAAMVLAALLHFAGLL